MLRTLRRPTVKARGGGCCGEDVQSTEALRGWEEAMRLEEELPFISGSYCQADTLCVGFLLETSPRLHKVVQLFPHFADEETEAWQSSTSDLSLGRLVLSPHKGYFIFLWTGSTFRRGQERGVTSEGGQ